MVHTLIIIALLIALISVLDFTIFRHHRLGFKYIPGLKLYNKAIKQTKQGNYTRAIVACTQALQQNPNLIEAYNQRGYARFLAGDTSGAIKDYNQAIIRNPSYIEAYINRAYASNKQGNRTGAIQDYNLATKLYLKQKDLINYRKTSETLKLLQRLDKTDQPVEEKPRSETTPIPSPTNNNFELQHGLYSAKIGDYKETIQYFNQALKINPQDSKAYYNRGLAHFKFGKNQEALADFSQALLIDSTEIEAYVGRGNLYLKTGSYQKAIEDYTKALEFQPNSPNIYYQRALAYSEKGEKQRSLKDKLQAQDDYQKAAHLFLEIGDVPNYKKAIKHLQKQPSSPASKPAKIQSVVEEKPTPETTPIPSTTNNYFEIEHGLYSAKIGDYKGAIQYFNQALKINPQDSKAYYNRGLAHFKFGKNQEALADFSQALLIDSTEIEAYVGRGNLYLKTGSYQKAIEDYTKALEFQPNRPDIYYQRALAYSEIGEKKRSLKDKLQAQDDYQKAANLFLEIGDIPNYEKAIKHLQKQTSSPTSKPAKIQSASLANSSKSKTKPQNQKQSPSLHLEKKLLTLLNGDRPTALRLIESAQSRNPHKQINWYYEKVIWDLERDRQR